MHVVMDIDGVVADFPRCFNDYVAREHGHERVQPESWEWFRDYPNGAAIFSEFMSERVLPNEIGTAVPVRGALAGLEQLQRFATITFCTYRPAYVVDQTRAWLSSHFGWPWDLVHTDDKTEVEGDLYVDDHPDTVHRLLCNGRKALMYLQPWNIYAELPFVGNWKDLVAKACRQVPVLPIGGRGEPDIAGRDL